MEEVFVNNKKYIIIKLLGHGKGGYSYLAKDGDNYVVIKKIHHEPCSYYNFGNKIESEKNDYYRLKMTGITIPNLIDIDLKQEIIVKEYIDGITIYDMVKDDISIEKYITQVRKMASLAMKYNLNIDYFPTNFVVQNDILYYIDYECNNYMDEWNFENWGIKYWSKTKEVMDDLNNHK